MMQKYYTGKQRCVVYLIKTCAVFYILEVGKTPTGVKIPVFQVFYRVTEKYCHLQTQTVQREKQKSREEHPRAQNGIQAAFCPAHCISQVLYCNIEAISKKHKCKSELYPTTALDQ